MMPLKFKSSFLVAILSTNSVHNPVQNRSQNFDSDLPSVKISAL